MLFLPPHPERKGEGGLRKKGYFKYSYEIENGRWYACNFRGQRLFEVEPSEEFEVDLKEFKAKNGVVRLPLITVITVVLNGKEHLEKTIQSVINQTYPNVEYIVIDGGSTDGTVDIIKKYDDYIDYWVSEPDRGIYDSWNKGVVLSNGKWLSFMGSGDLYVNDALSNYILFLGGYSDIENVLYISSKIMLTRNGQQIKIIGEPWKWKVFARYMNVGHIGSLHARKLFKFYGMFNEYFKIAGDYELLLRPKENLCALFLDKVTVYSDADGISRRNKRVFKEALIAKALHTEKGFLLLTYDFILAVIKWKIKKLIGIV